MTATNPKNLKISILGASLLIATTAVTHPADKALTSSSDAHANRVTATLGASATATPSFLEQGCPVNILSTLAATEIGTPESVFTPSPEAASATETVVARTYHDGRYLGDDVRASGWGRVQVIAVIDEGKLADIIIAHYPHSASQSNAIAHRALPTLICEALEAQDADIDFVSRATDTSRAFTRSLESALLAATSGHNA